MTKLFGGSIATALIHAATQYDIKQEKRRGYNHYALAQYFNRIDEVLGDIKCGASPREALCAGFSGPLLNALLRGIGEKSHKPEGRDGRWSYRPVASR